MQTFKDAWLPTLHVLYASGWWMEEVTSNPGGGLDGRIVQMVKSEREELRVNRRRLLHPQASPIQLV